MTLRDFDNFLFFPWIRWFLHATVFAKKWCKTKWSCFYINARAFVILTAFCVKKQYFSSFLCFVFRLIRPWKYLLLNFHNVYICFPIDIPTKPISHVMKNSDIVGLKDNFHGDPKTGLWDRGGFSLENCEFSKFWLHFKVSESFNVFWGNANTTTILKRLGEEISSEVPMLRCNKINVSIERWCRDCTLPW